ncbi:MAG: hypothetical protein A2X61_02100 [Ignavibacteria bacterium GWB2_35_12]|nr:MAG: hypothetical protein A2X63_12140 [Ignavibacteria bacterium GWA2_35_8]OGU38677.1 MAG: hypothetical protein A2X61_02100 [Ignavibacteria bacterium GWB2_35_12]OGU88808.1 MAG: hypothetical protein A2220_16715 [Ignavibacteria bacterium RIFOXYA2_FULL_35_10]OGV20905.1 MAG: hypothetical protein A2475_02085 [Ignavibacteria bacterium RIFOXYC2_FULL_35_21]
MGQLFNRISRYIKSETQEVVETDLISVSTHHYKNDSDEELKKIIDELNKDKTAKDKSSDSSKDNSTQKNEKKVFTLDDAYSILGLKSEATNDEIKSAYKQKVKEYHPDRVANLGEELKQLAEQKTQQINKSYEMLKKYRGFN